MEKDKKTYLKTLFSGNIRQYTMLIALIGIWLIFSVLTKGVFISPRNLSNLFLQSVAVAIVAVGMTFIIVTRNIDLSVGSVAAFTGAVAAFLQVKLGWPTGFALLASVLSGLLIGVWHGFWSGYRLVPSFIVTLASMMIFRGAVLGITKGETIAPLSDTFRLIGQHYLSHKFSIAVGVLTIICFIIYDLNRRRQRVKYGFAVSSIFRQSLRILFVVAAIVAFFTILISNRGVPYSVLLLMLLAFIFHFIAKNTVFGRQLYAIGGNPDAATLSGVNINKKIMFMFMIFGVITAVSGIVLTSRLNAATTSAGQGMELDVIAAVVIGGTSLLGGEGTVLGSVIGALIMASLDNGMSLMDTEITYQYIIKGMILLLAVWMDIATKKRT
ncbi:MAG: sugar ABC transporter permease [Candidatus Omnitrophica bacterium]|nr:sugar ABC transporter permease [Candidatus Omnitrophota bacterium]